MAPSTPRNVVDVLRDEWRQLTKVNASDRPWLIIILSFIIETLVVRHYGFAVVFITPVTILLAEAATLGAEPAGAIIQSRFFDTVLGCLVGLAGGFCLHSHTFRERAGGQIRRLVPARFGKPR